MTDVTCVPSAGSCWIHLTGTSDAIRWSLEGFNFGPFLEIIGSQAMEISPNVDML